MTAREVSDYRSDLPLPLPRRMRSLPMQRGYPVPWFVARLDDGTYDFRVADGRKLVEALRYRRCWLCGQPLGAVLAFVIRPMCAINRTTGEPPCHADCADWAARACPFLNQRQQRRREGNLPAEAVGPAGIHLPRQAGVTLIYHTKRCRPFTPPGGGTLIDLGEPLSATWYRAGRPATRAEVLESIDGGYPELLRLAEEDGPRAVAALTRARERAMVLLPAETTHEEEASSA